MDTDELVLNEKDNYEVNDIKPNNTNSGIVRIQTLLRNNPEIPDALRELAPFMSGDVRQGMIRMAAIGDFMLRMVDNSPFGVNSTDAPLPLSSLYGTMKKYIPLDKRQKIDGIMSAFDMLKTKMSPKTASNGLESIINSLSRINEMSKLVSSAGAAKGLAEALKNSKESGKLDISNVMGMISNLIGSEKTEQITGMLGNLIGNNEKQA